jgi:phosphatidylinositol glycan class C protein
MAASQEPAVPFDFCPWDGEPFVEGLRFCSKCNAPRLAAKKLEKYRPPWQKVLYLKQPYEDNYTDESFLSSMITNANFVKRDYWTVVRDSTVISQQICTVAVVSAVSTLTLTGGLTANALLALDAVSLLLGFVAFLLKDPNHARWEAITRNAFNCLLFVSGVYVLSPILQTLTRSISSDTIWALSIGLLLMHLFFHDYSYSSTHTTKFSGKVSVNAAIFASVLVSSRLPSHMQVFALVLFSLELFVLFPVLRHHVKKYSQKRHVTLSLSMISLTTGLLLPLNALLTAVFLALIFFVTFICPYWLIRIEKYKYEINGPWDEALPVVKMD